VAQNNNELNTGRLQIIQTDSTEYLFDHVAPTVYGDGVPLLERGAFWLGGLDVNQQLYMHANNYYSYSDDQPGPLMMNSVDYASMSPIYHRTWKMTTTEIDFHRQHFSQPGYVPSPSILEWPGNPPSGALFNGPLAPYIDSNANGLYDPMNGDYPLIKGDEAIYFIRNNDCIHNESGGDTYMVELHYMIYVFTNTTDELFERVFFTDINVRNHGTQTSYDTYMGIFHSPALGNYNDNFIGTNVELGMQFWYNADAFDEPLNGYPGFENFPAAFGMMVLSGPLQDADGVDNPLTQNISVAIDSNGIPYSGLGFGYGNGIVDDERKGLSSTMYIRNGSTAAMAMPQVAIHYYNYLRARWTENSFQYYGGNGHGSSSQAISNGFIASKYVFPDNSDSLFWGTNGVSVPIVWNEGASGMVPGDPYGIASSGPFTFTPGTSHTLELAYLYARDTTGGSSVDQLFNDAHQLRSIYTSGEIPGHGSFFSEVNEVDEIEFHLFPNPAENILSIAISNFQSETQIEILDLSGRLMFSGKLSSSNLSIDVSGLAQGMYLVRITNASGSLAQRFLKQ
jgi:hypothetical protein